MTASNTDSQRRSDLCDSQPCPWRCRQGATSRQRGPGAWCSTVRVTSAKAEITNHNPCSYRKIQFATVEDGFELGLASPPRPQAEPLPAGAAAKVHGNVDDGVDFSTRSASTRSRNSYFVTLSSLGWSTRPVSSRRSTISTAIRAKTVSPDSIYLFLDRLNARYADQAQRIAYKHSSKSLKTINVVFYDMTSLYFEAEDEDDLRIRPRYHRRRRRIEAHVLVAFVAYTIYKELERRLAVAGLPVSPRRAAELTQTMYELTFRLPNTPDDRRQLLAMDPEQKKLYGLLY